MLWAVQGSQTAFTGVSYLTGLWRDLLKSARSGKMLNKYPEDWLDLGMLEGWEQKGGGSKWASSF